MEYLQTTFGIECFPNFVVDYFDNKRDGGLLRKREFEHARIQTKSCELKRMTRPDVNTRQNVTILVQSGADVHFATLMMKYGIMESDKISKVCLFTGDGDFSEVLDLIENNFTGRSVEIILICAKESVSAKLTSKCPMRNVIYIDDHFDDFAEVEGSDTDQSVSPPGREGTQTRLRSVSPTSDQGPQKDPNKKTSPEDANGGNGAGSPTSHRRSVSPTMNPQVAGVGNGAGLARSNRRSVSPTINPQVAGVGNGPGLPTSIPGATQNSETKRIFVHFFPRSSLETPSQFLDRVINDGKFGNDQITFRSLYQNIQFSNPDRSTLSFQVDSRHLEEVLQLLNTSTVQRQNGADWTIVAEEFLEKNLRSGIASTNISSADDEVISAPPVASKKKTEKNNR